MSRPRKKKKLSKTGFGLWAIHAVGVPSIYAAMKVIARTWRVERTNYDLLEKNQPYILAIWHGDLIPGATELPLFRPVDIVVSRSNDGRIMGHFVRLFGAGMIAGSSSRGGVAAMRGMQRSLKHRRNFIAAVDGPRGPAGVVKAGVIMAAAHTGAPIIPGVILANKYWQMRSWDRAQIPKPFAKVRFVCGDIINVPQDASRDELEQIRQQLELQLRQLREQYRFPK